MDSHGALRLAYDSFLSTYGILGTTEEFNELSGPSVVEIVNILRGRYDLKPDSAKLYADYYELIERGYTNAVQPTDGAQELLSFLRSSHLASCLVTSAPIHLVLPFLVDRNWQPFFDSLVTGDLVSRSKPHPDIYLKAMRLLKCQSTSVIAIEDSINGVRAASAAGLSVVGVSPLSQGLYKAGALHVCESLNDLRNFLKDDLGLAAKCDVRLL